MGLFKSLKKKLNGFTRKAEEELEDIIEVEVLDDSQVDASEIVDDTLVEVIPEEMDLPEGDAQTGKTTSLEDIKKVRRIVEAQVVGDAEFRPGAQQAKQKQPGFGSRKIREGRLDEVLSDLEMILLESDIAFEAAEHVISSVKDKLLNARVRRKEDVGEYIGETLREAITEMLGVDLIDFEEFIVNASERPVKIMFVGVNGTGKTTAIARIAYRLKKMGRSVVLAAGDTFRAGAIEQLQIHADRLGIKLIRNRAGSDPAAVAFDAVEHARARHRDVVLIDTAGRMQTNINLMNEMKKMKQVARPDLIVFVGDSLAGNDAIDQARKFDEAVGIDCAILTKIDADAKGGAALSIAYAVGKPILFLGIGQGYEDLQPYSPEWMVKHIFEDDEE